MHAKPNTAAKLTQSTEGLYCHGPFANPPFETNVLSCIHALQSCLVTHHIQLFPLNSYLNYNELHRTNYTMNYMN